MFVPIPDKFYLVLDNNYVLCYWSMYFLLADRGIHNKLCIVSKSPVLKSPVSKSLVSNSPVSKSLVSKSLVSKSPVSKSLVSNYPGTIYT